MTELNSNIENNYVVIMAGGVGSRFWPYSRKNFPKQFHDVLGIGKSLLQVTVDRFSKVCKPENIYIVTNSDYYDLVKEQLPFCQDDQILLEPVGKNTAPCIAYASYKIASKNPKARLVVCPSDHIILKEDTYINIVSKALDVVSEKEVLVTLGITPTRPDTGFGYINFKQTESISKEVIQFKEKPDLETAKSYLEQGTYVWNAGIFVWSAKKINESFKKLIPELHELFVDIPFYDEKEGRAIGNIYPKCPSISIDYAVLEKSNEVEVILSDIGWSDLGTWKSLYEIQDKDIDQNVIDGNVVTYDTTDCIVKTPRDKLVVVQGLDNYIIAEYDNVLMVCSKDKEQMVKTFVEDLKAKKKDSFY